MAVAIAFFSNIAAAYKEEVPVEPYGFFDDNTIERAATGCKGWKIVTKPKSGDYAIVESAVRIRKLKVKHVDWYFMMRGSIKMTHKNANWNMGTQVNGYGDDRHCFDFDIDVNNERGKHVRWAQISKKLMKKAGMAPSKAGASALAGPGGKNGNSVDGLGRWAAETTKYLHEECEHGYMGVVSYPVAYKSDAKAYFTSGKIQFMNKHYKFAPFTFFKPKVSRKGNGSRLDECWGDKFQDKHIPQKTCTETTGLYQTYNKKNGLTQKVGEVQIEHIIKAWVRGRLVDGEIQKYMGKGKYHISRQSFYGPLSTKCSP